MPDSRSVLEILVDVKNAQQGAGRIRDVGKAATDTGKSAETAGQGFGGMAKNLAAPPAAPSPCARGTTSCAAPPSRPRRWRGRPRR